MNTKDVLENGTTRKGMYAGKSGSLRSPKDVSLDSV